MKKHRPKIGISLDWEKEGTFSRYPHFALRENYFNAIYEAGGFPIAIPHITKALDEFLDNIAAVIIPGGGFAFSDEWYVDLEEPAPYDPSPRLAFDTKLIEQTLIMNKPLLGICAGMQMMGCINGCKMTRNLHKYLETEIDHWEGQLADQYAHQVNVKPGTLLEKITGRKSFDVNTRHKEALVEIPENVTINCTAPDNVVEGIELPHYRFAIGVQWHPEFFIGNDNPNFALFKALIEAAR